MPNPLLSDYLSQLTGQSADQLMGGPAPAPRTYTPMPEGAPSPLFFDNSGQFDLSPNKTLGQTLGAWDKYTPQQKAAEVPQWKNSPQGSSAIANWGQLSPDQQKQAVTAWDRKPAPVVTQRSSPAPTSQGPADISGWPVQAQGHFTNYQAAKARGDTKAMQELKNAAQYWLKDTKYKWTPAHD